MLPELDRLIGSHLDLDTLTNATRVCKLWHSIFNPLIWKKLLLHHVQVDDDIDEDFSFISRATPPSPSASLPSSCSSTWSSLSMNVGPATGVDRMTPLSPPTSPYAAALPKLSLLQQAFLNSSRNPKLKGLVRHGHLVQELKATGFTDQEMDLIGILCPSLRVLELFGGRYTAENLTDLFQRRSDSLQIVRFRSCVLLKDIFLPLRHLTHLQEFELHGSFVGNTITSPYFFERDLFPMLQACPRLRSILIDQVHIIDQHVDQGRWDGIGGGGGGGGGTGMSNYPSHLPIVQQSMVTPKPMMTATPSALSLTTSTLTSMLSVQLRAASQFVHQAPTKSSLKSLTLDCGDIPDSVIMALLARCPLLERLSLDGSRTLSDGSLVSLQRICPNLTEISLWQCEQITEDGFKRLFRGFPNLSSIQLNGNVLSDSLLEDMAKSCRFLRQLSINNCQNVTDLGIQAVLLNCAYLESFSLRFVSGLSWLLFGEITMTPDGDGGFLVSPLSSSPGLSTSPSSAWLLGEMSRFGPPAPRQWACRDTLKSLHLPDLTQPNRVLLNRWQYQQAPLQSDFDDGRTPGDRLIQSRLQRVRRLKHLTIGGYSLDARVVLDGLDSARELETIRITKLKRTLTLDDARWLVEEAAPNLRRLVVPVFGNRAAIEWLEEQWPDLMSHDK